jgi:adenosylcobinamide-GDP ribazoletransferase
MGRIAGWGGDAWKAFRLALAFLTVLPVRVRDEELTEADLAASRFAFPLVGGLIGLVLAGLSLGLQRAGVAPPVAAFLLVASGVGLTGGLHLDGLADTADGLFLGCEAERRLAVMRDPHVGSFGVTAVVLVILGKYAVLSSLAGSDRSWGVLGWSIVGRSLVLASAGTAGYARPQGTGRVLVEATRGRDAGLAAMVVLAVGFGIAGWTGIMAALVTVGLAWGISHVATARLGGVTGDTLGALVELGELAFGLILTMGLGGGGGR